VKKWTFKKKKKPTQIPNILPIGLLWVVSIASKMTAPIKFAKKTIESGLVCITDFFQNKSGAYF
jgi:hypothetical protein